MSASREVILARVRDAIAVGTAQPAAARGYRSTGVRDRIELIELLCERICDYRAQAQRVSAKELPIAIAAAFASHGAKRVAVPPGIPPEWLPDGVAFVPDDELSHAELDGLDGVLTGCTVAIAETGTIVLAAGPSEGRRALTLIPDLHVCVVDAQQVVELVPEAIATIAALVREERRPITLVSGPSATSDIELNRVEGVHGPRTLVVLILERSPNARTQRVRTPRTARAH
jgi:L-lactate dehydrogenase complex protein LldG